MLVRGASEYSSSPPERCRIRQNTLLRFRFRLRSNGKTVVTFGRMELDTMYPLHSTADDVSEHRSTSSLLQRIKIRRTSFIVGISRQTNFVDCAKRKFGCASITRWLFPRHEGPPCHPAVQKLNRDASTDNKLEGVANGSLFQIPRQSQLVPRIVTGKEFGSHLDLRLTS
jgi:hypothetical protein